MNHHRIRPVAGVLALLGACCLAAGASEIAVPGYPAIDDPFDLGLRGSVIVFLKEHGVGYDPGDGDTRLLERYRAYWDARRPQPAKPEPARPVPAEPRPVVDRERENLELQLRHDYRYTNTAGKDAAELRQVLEDLRRRDASADASAVAAPRATVAGSGPAASAAAAVEPAAARPAQAAPSSGASARPGSAPLPSFPVPKPENNPRNQDLRPAAELRTALKRWDLEAYLQLCRRLVWGLGVEQDDKELWKLQFDLQQSPEGMEMLREKAAGGDEVAEYMLSKIARNATHPDEEESERLLRLAAEHGLPDAIYDLSVRYKCRSPQTPQDQEQADRLLRQAAESGSLRAIRSIYATCKLTLAESDRYQRLERAIRAHNGDATDPETIIRRAREAGEVSEAESTRQLHYLGVLGGSVESQLWLGRDYMSKDPTPEQDRMCRFWLGQAALRGNHNAMVMLASVLGRTKINPPDPVVAYTWLVRAAGGTRPHGPEWEAIEARVGQAGREAAFADAARWEPIPADTPVTVPADCVVKPPMGLPAWPESNAVRSP